MFLIPEGKVTTLWEGWLGLGVLGIYWENIRGRYPRGDHGQEAVWFPRANDRWKAFSRNRWLRRGHSFG